MADLEQCNIAVKEGDKDSDKNMVHSIIWNVSFWFQLGMEGSMVFVLVPVYLMVFSGFQW